VLEELGYQGAKVATAVNGGFVARGLRAETRLREGDRVEVIAPMQGG
jgi:sulfur carrier protein